MLKRCNVRATLIAALLSATALASHAALAQQPGCGTPHGRLSVIPYAPLTIYECDTSPDVATSIVTASSELVGPNAAPDTDGVLIQTAANMIVFHAKPDEVGKSPNLTFETKQLDGQFRQYYFIFHVKPSGGVAAIQLTYPDDELKAKKMMAAERQEAVRNDVIESRLKTAVFNGPRPNWEYDCMCDAGPRLRPDDFWDNGQETVIRYIGGKSTAVTVARLDRDGTEKAGDLPHRETPIGFTPVSGPKGDMLVIPHVSEYWTIRSGNEVIAIKDKNYHPELVDLRTGSQSTTVVRTVKPTILPTAKGPAQPAGQPAGPPPQPPRVAQK
jgi:type IV secretory pathway VirB9-like protein